MYLYFLNDKVKAFFWIMNELRLSFNYLQKHVYKRTCKLTLGKICLRFMAEILIL